MWPEHQTFQKIPAVMAAVERQFRATHQRELDEMYASAEKGFLRRVETARLILASNPQGTESITPRVFAARILVQAYGITFTDAYEILDYLEQKTAPRAPSSAPPTQSNPLSAFTPAQRETICAFADSALEHTGHNIYGTMEALRTRYGLSIDEARAVVVERMGSRGS